MKNIVYFLIVCFYLTPMLAPAAIVEGLYEAEITVVNQSKAERQKAMGQGLGEVFVKVSGNPQILAVEGIQAAMNKAGSYLQQFLYRRPSDIKNVDPNAGRAQILWLLFDEKSVNQLLRENGEAVWGRTRPATLIWLAVEQDGGRFLLGSDSREELVSLLKYQAKRQGLAILLPLLDLQDQRQLNFTDVWGGFREPIEMASQRYQAEAILVGRMSLSRNDIWTARWSLYEGSEPVAWESQGQFADEIVKHSLSQVVGTLASRYKIELDDGSSGVMQLAVNGVLSLEQYAQVSDYLQSLQPVKVVQPLTINDTTARYRLQIRGSAEGVVRIIALGNVLKTDPMANRVDPNSSFDREPDSDYQYRLTP